MYNCTLYVGILFISRLLHLVKIVLISKNQLILIFITTRAYRNFKPGLSRTFEACSVASSAGYAKPLAKISVLTVADIFTPGN